MMTILQMKITEAPGKPHTSRAAENSESRAPCPHSRLKQVQEAAQDCVVPGKWPRRSEGRGVVQACVGTDQLQQLQRKERHSVWLTAPLPVSSCELSVPQLSQL